MKTLLQHTGPNLGHYQGVRIIDCTTCGFVHVDPLPTLEDLAALYDEKFYASDKAGYLEKAEAEQPYWREAVYRYRYDTLETLLSESEAPKRILDIGCSGGFFLKYGLERGWQVMGIEPSRQAAAYARKVNGVEVIADYFQNVAFNELAGRFDAVNLRNVLEHLPNPRELCEKAAQCLKSGGIICIEVPNDFNPLQTLARRQNPDLPEYWVVPDHHLNYFNRETLTNLLEQTGFTVLDAEGSFPMEFFLLMGEQYVGNDALGLSCHQKRMAYELSLSQTAEGRQIRNQLYRFYATLNLGRTLTVYAQKNTNNQTR